MITSKKLTTLLTCGEDERFSLVDKMSEKAAKDLLKYLNYSAIFNIISVGQSVMVGDNNSQISINNGANTDLTPQERDLLRIYRTASGKTQMEIMKFMYDIENKA